MAQRRHLDVGSLVSIVCFSYPNVLNWSVADDILISYVVRPSA